MLQLRPLRVYFTGEVVAIEAAQVGASEGYVYAEIDSPPHDAPSGGGQIALRVGGARALVH
eukprot:3514380-Prymnesium_polylepis.1